MQKRRGFTTVELVIVIAVIAILATALIPTFGGLIKSANHNVDVQTANTLTKIVMMHSINNKITEPRELAKAIDAEMGNGYFENLTAKSANYGYYYWYDFNNGQFVVKTVEEIAELSKTTNPADPDLFFNWGITMSAEKSVPKGFKGGLRSAMFPGYYLVGSKGEFGSLITELENVSDGGEYQEAVSKVFALNDTYSGTPLGEAVDKLTHAVKTTVIINDHGAFRNANIESVVNYYFTIDVTDMKNTEVYTYKEAVDEEGNTVCEADDGNPATDTPIVNLNGGTLELPEGVKVEIGGLPNNEEYPIIIVVPAKTVEELKEIFGKNATDCDIIYNGQECVLEGEAIVNKNNPEEVVVGGLEGEDVKDFNITCPGISTQPGEAPIYYVSSTKTIFVAYDHIGADNTFKLGLTSGLAASQVTWTSSNEGLISVVKGKVTVNKKIAVGESNSATITVTYGEGESAIVKNISVVLVRPNDVDFTVDGTGYNTGSTGITITYNGTTPTFQITGIDMLFSTGDNTPVVKFDPTLSVLFSSTGSVFDLTYVDHDEDETTPKIPTITLKKFEGTQQMTVSIGDHLSKTFTVTVIDNSGAAFDKNWIVDEDGDKDVADKENTNDIQIGDKYLFRVGNKNTFKLSDLFYNLDKPAQNVAVHISVTGPDVKVNGTTSTTDTWYLTKDNWDDATVQFTGTGIAEITIGNYIGGNIKDSATLKVEVVNATNVTKYSELTSSSCVLLADITLGADKHAFSNATLFGNGFTFDVSTGGISGGGYITSNYLICLTNSHLDNVRVVGPVYKDFNITASKDYNRAVVLAQGNSGIYNSYISNGMSPVRITGNGQLLIDNSTLKGGVFANIDIRGGRVTLKDVTTINQVDSNDKHADGTTVIGMGITVWYDGTPAETRIIVEGTLTQYNHISKKQADTYITSDLGSRFVDEVFSSKYSAYQYNDGTTTWINAGIISLCDKVGKDNMLNANGTVDKPSGYTDTAVSVQIPELGKRVSGYLWTTPTATVQTNYTNVPSAWVPFDQYPIAPSYSFDYNAEKNYDTKDDTKDNDYCYWSANDYAILIGMDEGDTKNWDPSILTLTKNGISLSYKVTMNGTDYTGKTIPFSVAGNYTVIYTYTDNNNYDVDGKQYDETYTKKIDIEVAVKAPDAKNAEFTFGSNGSTTVKIGDDIYVMPDVTGTSATIGSTTVSGTTVYYPIITGYTSNGKTSQTSGTNWYMYFPVFKDVKGTNSSFLTITDYANGGLGDATVYDGSTTALPSGLAAINPATSFQYSSANTAPTTPKNASGVLVYTSPEMEGVNRDASKILVKFSYKDNAGATYYYFVRYDTPAISNTSCVTPDTLVTLADGSKKEIQHVTTEDMLLVWNHFTGKYDVVPAAIIFDHGFDYNTVIKLNFSDGTQVKAINIHQFLDVENGYVSITAETVAQYVGHSFAKRDGDSYTTVTLESYEISEEYIEAYGIISAIHYNILVEDMFSTDFMLEDYDLFNYFTIGDGLVFDAEKMEEDIAKYGLYTYEDFADYLTYEQFVAFNVQYFKIAVGKGNYTYEGILGLIDFYLNG